MPSYEAFSTAGLVMLGAVTIFLFLVIIYAVISYYKNKKVVRKD